MKALFTAALLASAMFAPAAHATARPTAYYLEQIPAQYRGDWCGTNARLWVRGRRGCPHQAVVTISAEGYSSMLATCKATIIAMRTARNKLHDVKLHCNVEADGTGGYLETIHLRLVNGRLEFTSEDDDED